MCVGVISGFVIEGRALPDGIWHVYFLIVEQKRFTRESPSTRASSLVRDPFASLALSREALLTGR